MKDYRAKSIIAVYSSITGNKSVPNILDTLKMSYTFNEILGGENDAINYESTINNLLDIIDELKQLQDYPKEVNLINQDSLIRYFDAIRAANLAGTDMSLDDYAKELMIM